MAAPTASGNGGTSAGAASPTLAGRWCIDPEAPLPAFDRPSAQAFAATEPQASARPLLALVCTSGLPFRAEAARLLVGSSVEGLLGLTAFGVVDWPAEHARLPVLIYERPMGDPVAAMFGDPTAFAVATGGEAIRRLLRPIVHGLLALQRLSIAHRGIRPDNLWFRDAENDAAVLGCALSGPAGWDQPSPFEPLERAMAERAGRGEGDAATDIYALGVTLLWLVTGPPPWSMLPDAEVLGARIDNGSYATLTRGIRVPNWLVEPLRRMLADDPTTRWTLRDVQMWLEGGPSPIGSSSPYLTPKACFDFAGKRFRALRPLAVAMAHNVPAAAQVIRRGSLQRWIRYGLHDPSRAKRIDDLVEGAESHPSATAGGDDDALVARTLLLLDESAPIRYRDAAFTVDGFGPALAKRLVDGGGVQTLVEAVAIGLPKLWLRQARAAGEDVVDRGRQLVALAGWLRDHRVGFGIERCLYVTNPGLPCLSPPLRASGVIDVRDLMGELEAAAATSPDDNLIDRHVAGFIAARIGEEAMPTLAGLSDVDSAASGAALLALLALVQGRQPDAPRPRLARWIGRKLPPVIAAFQHRPTRTALEREAARKIIQGDLCGLHALIGDPERRRRDEDGFRGAAAAWKRAEIEIASLGERQAQRQLDAQSRGMRVAAFMGLSAACVSIGVTIVFTLR